MDYKNVIYRMVFENKSIREMAKEIGVPKSTLHYRLKKVKGYIDDEDLLLNFEMLMKDNKDGASVKGGVCRWKHKNINEEKKEETKC